MSYRVRNLTPDECDAIAGWRYEGCYATYEFAGPPNPAEGHFAVEDGSGDLIGCCCFGGEARVPGVEPEEGVVDVGYGMRPDLVGQGRGQRFVASILAHASTIFDAQRFRVLVLDWNQRSLAACRHAGFARTGEVSTDSGAFVVLEHHVQRAGKSC